MTYRIRLMALSALFLLSAAALAQDTATITATYTLPDLKLADVQNAILADSIDNDRGLLLGGIGSDLWHGADAPANEFWMITDRGPNGEVEVGEETRRTFPIPSFTPHILKVSVEGEAITVLETLPIVNAENQPVTGLSNLERDEKPYDFSAEGELELNQEGLDSEGLVRASSGDFWVADEYGPSLVKINAEGQIVKRFVPQGIVYDATSFETVDSLPAVYASRRGNRGFEGLALSPDETTLYIALQSPLRNPDKATGDASRNTRILAFDIATETVVGEYVYQFQEASEFGEDVKAGDLKVSGLIAFDADTLLVLERTDDVAKIYRAELTDATNIAGTAWDDAATAPSLEAATDLAASEVTPLAKTLVIDLSTLEGTPKKIEGIALIDPQTLVIANDNDFDIGTFDASGNNEGEKRPSQIFVITLAEPLQ